MRGRRWFLAALAGASLVALGAASFCFRSRIGEEIDILVLRWGREEAAEAAAGRLAGRGSARAVPLLVSLMKEKVSRAFVEPPHWTEEALQAIGETAVPALVRMAEEDDADFRWHAVAILCRMGPGARGAIPALERLLNDPEDYVRNHAADALERIRQ